MTTMLRKFIGEDDGADLIEYALIAGLLAFGVILAMDGMNTSITNFFTNVSTKLGDLVR
jgi:Flp pilus assembly pilin Flp